MRPARAMSRYAFYTIADKLNNVRQEIEYQQQTRQEYKPPVVEELKKSAEKTGEQKQS
jgi:hypothetical protein